MDSLGNTTNVLRNKTKSCKLSKQDIIFLSICCLIILFGIIGNGLVLYIFRHGVKRKRKTYEILIWYLSLFDFIASVIASHEIYERSTCYQNWPFGWFGCKTMYSCYYISINISICILIIIAIDRYRCIVTPFKKKFTTQLMHMLVFISVCISFALQWYQFLGLNLKTGLNNNKKCIQNREWLLYTIPRTSTILFRDVVFILVFSITTFTVHISFKVREKRSLATRHSIRNKQKNRRIFNMLSVMGSSFLLLVVPYDIWDCTMTISQMLPTAYRISINTSLQHLDTALTLLQMMNSIANCIIYAKMHRHFKNSILRCLKKNQAMNLLVIPDFQQRYSNTTLNSNEAESFRLTKFNSHQTNN